MTAHKRLGALFATAFLALALSGGAAMAGHGHKQDKSQSWGSQYRYGQDGSYRHQSRNQDRSYRHQSYNKGKAFGRNARRYHLRNGGNHWRPRAYGHRGRNNYVYGNGFLFKRNHGDHRARGNWRKRMRAHRDHRHQHSWRGDSRFMFGQHDGQADRQRNRRVFSGSGFGGGGDGCFIKSRKKTVDGQRRLITKEVCRGANGKTYTVRGSRVVRLLD